MKEFGSQTGNNNEKRESRNEQRIGLMELFKLCTGHFGRSFAAKETRKHI